MDVIIVLLCSLGGIFIHSLLMAIGAVQQMGKENYNVATVFNATLEFDEKIFVLSAQQVCSCQSGLKDSAYGSLVVRDSFDGHLHLVLRLRGGMLFFGFIDDAKHTMLEYANRDIPAGEVRLRPKPPPGECASNVGLSNCWSHFGNMLLKIFKDAGGKQHFGQVSKGSLEQLLDGQGA